MGDYASLEPRGFVCCSTGWEWALGPCFQFVLVSGLMFMPFVVGFSGLCVINKILDEKKKIS